MSSVYSSVQAHIKATCPFAIYIPCSGRSLKLIGFCAADCSLTVTSFFLLLQELYNFFSCSTHRWAVLCHNSCTRVLYSLSKTRREARHNACLTLNKDCNSVIKSLYVIANDEHQPKDTKNEASSLKGKLDSLETFNKVSKKLQSKTIDLGQIKLHYSALSVYVSN